MNKAVLGRPKGLPIGISDYKEIIETNCYYIDKTMLISDLLSVKDKVTLICRPRRFGKTLNLSMLRYFFEKTDVSNAHLFSDKLVWHDTQARAYQGQHSVIFISFKEIKDATFAQAYDSMILLILKEFQRYENILLSGLSRKETEIYQMIMTGAASSTWYKRSLLFLSGLLEAHYKKRVVVLLDEYDTPIHTAYIKNYYQEMVDFIQILFGNVLKDNSHLERAVLTSIVRTAKESIFPEYLRPYELL